VDREGGGQKGTMGGDEGGKKERHLLQGRENGMMLVLYSYRKSPWTA
jgi:hypothetical protein